VEFNEELTWDVKASHLLKHQLLVSLWGNSKFGKKNVPLGEVCFFKKI